MPFPPICLPDHNTIPSIAYGTGSVNKGNDIHDYVENALEQGFEHIDTAQCMWRRLILGFEFGLSSVKQPIGTRKASESLFARADSVGLTFS